MYKFYSSFNLWIGVELIYSNALNASLPHSHDLEKAQHHNMINKQINKEKTHWRCVFYNSLLILDPLFSIIIILQIWAFHAFLNGH